MGDVDDAIEVETMLLGRSHTRSVLARGDVGAGLVRSGYVLLSLLERSGPMSIGELSHTLGLDASTLNRQTHALLESSLLERIPDPDGGIARKLRLTRQGASLLEEERSTRSRAVASMLEDWSDDEKAAFATALRRFNAVVEERTGTSWPRAD